VVIANDLSEPETKVGQRVVILGGGQVGCESAVHLAREGKTVTVVEMLDELAKDANGRQRPILLEVMQELKIETKTGLRGVAVTKDGLTCADKDAGRCSSRRIPWSARLGKAPAATWSSPCATPRR
jgi:pyruvate/2-oxoglutarate dehydrogenase complex dihydrolipoamide dehydrogenase (E3) component